MGTFNDGDSGSSIRTKINTAIEKTEGTSAISTIDVDGGAIDGVTLGTNSAVTEAQVDNININGNTISSTDTNGDVTIDPNGTGDVNIGNFKFDADQTVGAGQDNYVLTYDNTGGKISLEAAAGGAGDFEFIASQSSTSFVSSISFTGLSMTNYSALRIIGRGIQYNTTPSIYVRLIDGTGSDITALNYNSQVLDADNGTLIAAYTTGGRDEWFGCGNGVISANTDVFYMADFSLSVDNKTAFLHETTLEKDGTTPFSCLCYANHNFISTTAISFGGLKFYSFNSTQKGEYYIYGLKNS